MRKRKAPSRDPRRAAVEKERQQFAKVLSRLAADLPDLTPAEVAAADQHSAAMRDRLDRTKPEGFTTTSAKPTPVMAATLFHAIEVRECRMCPHVLSALAAGEMIAALLTIRYVCCPRCIVPIADAFDGLPTPDDGLCDFCNLPSEKFREYATIVGQFLIAGCSCPDCDSVLLASEEGAHHD